MRRLGLDFDNTIVCYDALFHRAALEAGLISAGVAQDKTAVRNHMRAQGQEAAWVALQGEVYGPRLREARPFPGLPRFLKEAAAAGWEVFVVSHKTRHPFAGPRWDLHEAARQWIGQHLAQWVNAGNVFLELTKEEKLSRIAALGCDGFVDDLPEILLAPGFPVAAQAWLFDPAGHCEPHARYQRISGWDELRTRLLREEAAIP